MNHQQKMVAIKSWQNSGMHPLTCVNCSRVLQPITNSFGEVVLYCDNCSHIQTSVPKVVYSRFKGMNGNED